MTSHQYKFKTFNIILNGKNESPSKNDHLNIDNGIACNDEYFISYKNDPLSPNNNNVELKNGSLWKCYFINCRWEKIKCINLPNFFKFNSILLSGNLVIIHGGYGPRFSSDTIYQTFIGDLSKECHGGIEFKEITSTNGIPKKGYGQPLVINGQYLYSINGNSMDDEDIEFELDVYRFDLSNNKWEVLYEANGIYTHTSNRYKHQLIFYNEQLYVFNRTQLDIHPQNNIPCPKIFKKIYVFDLKHNKWQYINMLPDKLSLTFPENRIHYAWAQSISQKQYIYMCGGFNETIFLKDVWRLNLITMEWSNLSHWELPKPAFFHSLTITHSGRMFYLDGLHGKYESGRCCEQSESLGKNYEIKSAWTEIPKLSTMCWDAMVYYFKEKMLGSSEHTLREMGIPSEYCMHILNAKQKI